MATLNGVGVVRIQVNSECSVALCRQVATGRQVEANGEAILLGARPRRGTWQPAPTSGCRPVSTATPGPLVATHLVDFVDAPLILSEAGRFPLAQPFRWPNQWVLVAATLCRHYVLLGGCMHLRSPEVISTGVLRCCVQVTAGWGVVSG